MWPKWNWQQICFCILPWYLCNTLGYLLMFQKFQFLLITDFFKIVSVDSGAASRRCNETFYVICITENFWIRSLQKRCLAFSSVLFKMCEYRTCSSLVYNGILDSGFTVHMHKLPMSVSLMLHGWLGIDLCLVGTQIDRNKGRGP